LKNDVARIALRSLRAAAGTALRRVGPTPRAGRYAFHYENVLGTSLELQVVATNAATARGAESAVLAEVDRLERILSGYSATSELALWQETRGVAVAVSPDLADVLDAAERWRIRTNGAFNPAAVSLVELLGDGSAHPTLRARLDELSQTLWSVNRARRLACRLTALTVSLDAIAKGYIIDRAVESARRIDGVSQVMLNVGGDLRHVGARVLTVAVTDPHAPADNAPPLATVRVRDEALATSGGYRRGFVANGCRVSHILDPRTGQPAERIASASVIAPDCATADALSTAFSVMEPRESVALADSLCVACLLAERDGTIITNAAWNARAVTQHHDTSHPRH
jgi:FAD:protein FMN transferase